MTLVEYSAYFREKMKVPKLSFSISCDYTFTKLLNSESEDIIVLFPPLEVQFQAPLKMNCFKY